MSNKKLIVGFAVASVSTLLMTTSAFASLDGFYVGGQVGWGKVHTNLLDNGDQQDAIAETVSPYFVTTNSDFDSSNSSGWAGRLYAGYQIDCHWAAELGWSKFRNVNADGTAVFVSSLTGAPALADFDGSLSTNAVDLVAKYTMPLQNNFSVYGKLGAAVIWDNASVDTTINYGGLVFQGSSGDRNETRVFPTFGVGLAYDFTPTVVGDIAYNRIQEVGGSDIGSTDMVTIGVAFHLG